MKIAVVGSSGYLGKFLVNRLKSRRYSVVKAGRQADADYYLDLCHPEEFNYGILSGIDYVVFTAAVSSPDECSLKFEYCWNINVTSTEYFMKKAVKAGCKIIFFSSDAVFGNFSEEEIYTEISETAPDTPYGEMKKYIEDSFQDNDVFKTIRLSYVVSAEDKFVRYCIDCAKNNKTAEIYHPFYRNCISITDVEDAVIWLFNNWMKFEYNALNIAGTELVSRIRIADEINRRFGNRLRYTIVEPEKIFFEKRPKIIQMKSLFLEKYNILKSESFTEKIQRELKEIKV